MFSDAMLGVSSSVIDTLLFQRFPQQAELLGQEKFLFIFATQDPSITE
jgi:hypothetical protein